MKRLIKKFYFLLFYGLVFRICRLFPRQENKIFFLSFHGRSFSGNPRAIYRHLSKHHSGRFDCVTALRDQNRQSSRQSRHPRVVPYHSLAFLYELATAGIWVLNNCLHPYLRPRSSTFYLQTWHGGGALKKIGRDAAGRILAYSVEETLREAQNWTTLLCSSGEFAQIYTRAFGLPIERAALTGAPRNDLFFDESEIQRVNIKLREQYRIRPDQKLILYAPTFRDHQEHFQLRLDLPQLRESLGDKFGILLRLHPLVARNLKLEPSLQGFAYDLSAHEDIQEMMVACAALITDYSSVIFDFCLTGRPMLFYAYDLEFYGERLRDFYYEFNDFVPGPIARDQSTLVELLSDLDAIATNHRAAIQRFARRFNQPFDGRAAHRATQLLLDQKKRFAPATSSDGNR